jgi:hypothetical protein
MAKFILPKLISKKPTAAVYKMVFDGWKYYIGGTTNIRQRMSGWKQKLNAGIRKNVDMLEVFKNAKVVKFEIIEFVNKPEIIKQQEDFYIKQNWGDPLLLNKSSNAFNNIGVKHSKNSLTKVANKSQMKKVAKVDGGGNILEIYQSIAEAERLNNVTNISNSLKKQGLRSGGEIYRLLNNNGEVIEPVYVARKPKKSGYKFSEKGKRMANEARAKRIESGTQFIPSWTKPVIQMTMNGEYIATHNSISAANKAIGCKDSKRLRRILNSRGGKSIHGFTFKFA